MMRALLGLSVFMLLASGPFMFNQAVADEAWMTNRGEVIYLEDLESGIAVFQLVEDAVETRFYLQGLAGNYYDRDLNKGYWISSNPNGGKGLCPAAMTGGDGFTGTSWGKLVMIHNEQAFPSSWTLTYSECFGQLFGVLRGTPL